MKPYNTDITTQVESLEKILRLNPIISQILDNSYKLILPQWYLGAGCIAQTVWNYLSQKKITANIKDYDLVYFEPLETSEESENRITKNVQALFHDMQEIMDVKNEARVHLWYKERFGYAIKPYRSVEEAINTWPTTATCIGVKCVEKAFKVYAPYGLNDLFSMVVRPNKLQITEGIYKEKVQRWLKHWPDLKIIPWQEEPSSG